MAPHSRSLPLEVGGQQGGQCTHTRPRPCISNVLRRLVRSIAFTKLCIGSQTSSLFLKEDIALLQCLLCHNLTLSIDIFMQIVTASIFLKVCRKAYFLLSPSFKKKFPRIIMHTQVLKKEIGNEAFLFEANKEEVHL